MRKEVKEIKVVEFIDSKGSTRDLDGESRTSRYYLPEDKIQMNHDIKTWKKNEGCTVKITSIEK